MDTFLLMGNLVQCLHCGLCPLLLLNVPFPWPLLVSALLSEHHTFALLFIFPVCVHASMLVVKTHIVLFCDNTICPQTHVASCVLVRFLKAASQYVRFASEDVRLTLF